MALSTNLGFPRIGKNREFKKNIEAFWKGTLPLETLTAELEKLHLSNLKMQTEAGLDFTPLGDFSAYDLMLETALMLGIVPRRFQNLKGFNLYYAMARGTQEAHACEMKKWFDSNYHYIVPEIEGGFSLTQNRLAELFAWAAPKFPQKKFRGVLIGPYTFLKLSRINNKKSFEENLKNLSAVYQKIVEQLASAGMEWLQIDEPSLCGDVETQELKWITEAYEQLCQKKGGLKIILQTYFGDVASVYDTLTALPVDGLGLDLVRGPKNKELLATRPFPKEKWLGLGIVDGRNVWRTHLRETLAELKTFAKKFDPAKIWVHPSSSVLHLPLSLEGEEKIPSVLKKRLAFAKERLGEVAFLTQGLNQGSKAIESELATNDSVWKDQEFASFALNAKVQKRLQDLKSQDFQREIPFKERFTLQQKHLNLPPLPTTTIGSFPQTGEIRQARAKWKKGEISQKDYEAFIAKEIESVVRLQEEMGLDVLVHGEPERTDMVEYFAERLKGFQFTTNGWVQSYGTRCIRPPVIYGDVWREAPMTVAEAKQAQSFTKKPMKGMLTGPATIVNWSFPRADVSKEASAFQIGLALRDEVIDLEKNGITVIQIDEPALREGLPLKKADWEVYLKWAVGAFKLSSSGVKATTQIHTHMCYSEFADILPAIQELDADVLSIEDSRSLGKLAKGLSEMHYRNALGPGVYDVHSEQIPPQEEFEKRVKFLVDNIPAWQLWINPDCGLKTRGYKEVTPALKNMVEAVKKVRLSL